MLKTSYTTANDGAESGAPMKDETEISDITQKTRDNDSNDPDNRV